MAAVDREVRLSVVGDVMLGGAVEELMKRQGVDAPFALVSGILQESDVVLANLESSLSVSGEPLEKCCVASPPEAARALRKAGVNAVSLANNHIFDYGYEAFEHTVALLAEEGVGYFGAGENLERARQPLILNIDGLSVGFLGYSWDFIGTVNATSGSFGTAPLREKLITEDVSDLRGRTDIVIVCLHWGYAGERYPLPVHRELAHRIIDAGAALIAGHHPHVLQGIERYRGGLIIYSLGNFIFPDISYKQYRLVQKPENKEAIIVQGSLSSGKGVESINVIPVRCNGLFQPVILDGADRQSILDLMGKLSRGFESGYSEFYKANRVRRDLPLEPEAFWSLSNLRYRFNRCLARLHKPANPAMEGQS